ncbi:hypothetical protein M0R45_029329 [Rubus argutus]|uniref:DUF295 domain-containing protein n=1 Tax=Rubus argutus TaxID=59490 RepID=A0AAW1W865_RUBAR
MDVLQCKEEDKFYVIKGRGELLTLNIDSESNSNVNSVAPGTDEIFLSRAYLVDSNGQDLLMIHRHCWEDCEQEKDGFATKFKRNCIYYNHDFAFMQMNNKLHDFGVYDMEKKTISKPYSKDVMILLEMVNQRPIWFTPTFQAR